MTITLTERFNDALVYTSRLHANQRRKGSGVPYIAHLLSVAALVLENGGDEEMAIAALLHDAVEDQGGMETLHEIQQRYGVRVADIVLACSDSFTQPKPPWQNRKEEYLKHLENSSWEVQLISLADKLHNARSILRDLKVQGSQIWEKFNGGKEGTLWYYRRLVDVYEQFDPNYLLDVFSNVVDQIEEMVNLE
jgi:(p)ppGpp synthase/HD superfamily hydrolase